MPFMNWIDDFSYGLAEIDDDHKKLVNLINELYDALESGSGHDVLGRVLDGLIHYVSYHFSHEEGIYLRAHYPDYEAHKKEHEALTLWVMDVNAKFRAGKEEPLPLEVLEFLKTWLYSHIMNSDKKFGLYLNTSGSGA
jgi:hemerythrin